ncbi:MAG: hypothetical protein E7G48_09075 [Veillonella sp.]|nr:hypothetical protein [Veillonella sp.]
MQVNAILFDVQSIQKYIFANNKLKANVGASYIVDRLFEDVLCKDVILKLESGADITSWKTRRDSIISLPASVYVAYIGGGKALILIDNDRVNMIEDIIKTFTAQVLTQYPGLKVGVTTGLVTLEKDQFKSDERQLFKQLKDNQYALNPILRPANTGLTTICDYSGDTADTVANFRDGERLVATSFISKYNAFEAANARLKKDLFGTEDIEWVFPSEFDELGQNKSTEKSKTGINDIAIVHIDGNNMGARFISCDGLEERSALSEKVATKTLESFKSLVQWIIDKYEVFGKHLQLKDKMLPIRPIIVGGDDITFVCNARIAVQAAHFLMQELLSDNNGMSISSCAGIAVIPTSYPFFRGYEMAEQLCDSAKSKMRAYNEKNEINESCWMDFAFLHGETAPTLEQFFANEYSSLTGNMHYGPYRVYEKGKTCEAEREGFWQLLACTNQFKDGHVMAQNKVKELRSVLQDNEHIWTIFLEQLQHTKQSMPEVSGWEAFKEKLWAKVDGKMRTPYIDAIELIDYILPGLE